ncbi:FtsW/RodA/SpoVE family cell cycle protein [Novosphingobium sp.]|uniref:FtsW/RodA/SpoVE family cell cycle protein n=1 Tax=Novosphingobium sp. TaxID=1874826 RepID=UPI0025EC77AA|nr:putative peptidoglycan glycosyltransferase FtsW [Novosphingobium sp.]
MASYPPFVPSAGRTSPEAAQAARRARNHRSEFAIWWREIDRVLLVLVLTLMAIGAVAVAASSPASARRLSTSAVRLDDLHFFYIHLRWQVLGLIAMFGASMLPRERARQAGILLGAAMLIALMLVPVIGYSVNGAKRWINLGFSLQPSEALKPCFAIGIAWILSWRARDPKIPVIAISSGLMGMVGLFLMMQPDFGSSVLFAGVWFVMVLMCGIPVKRIAALAGAGMAAVVLAYMFYENGRHRIDAFLGGGTAFDQVDLAQKTILAGGWTGTGLWLGTRKLGLPEAHTDYIFSVIGEEFGLLACAVIVALYLALVLRVMLRLLEEEDLFTTLAAAGLTAQLGGQAFINILVNLQLFPSKGMTLPLISYGGSSTIALCLGVGFLIAITRRNPFLKREGFSLRQVGLQKPGAGK